MILAMIPARMGSQRLKQKNLHPVCGLPLITHAIRKCIRADVFDEIWVNSEHTAFKQIAKEEGVLFHHRPESLASNTATSEDYIFEFLCNHSCDFLFQVHSIAPLLSAETVRGFVNKMRTGDLDVLLSCVEEQIECAMNGLPVNFTYDRKQNSQELTPIQRVTWSITAWRRETYMRAYEAQECATYAGKVGFFPIDRMGGHIIKNEEDLKIADMFMKIQDMEI
jgi:CMP-N-acetylneuraminic acid synthetase